MVDSFDPRNSSNVPVLYGVNKNNAAQVLPVYVDPSINGLVVAGTINASNPSVGTTAATAPTSATEIGVIDGGGNLVGVSAANPLPISGTISATSAATYNSSPPTFVSGTSNALQADVNGNLKVAVVGTIPVSGAFYQATQPVSIAGDQAVNVTQINASTAFPLEGNTFADSKIGFMAFGRSAGTGAGSVVKPLLITAAGALTIDGSAVTQPVSIATMPSTPVTGTFYQVTQPVSVADGSDVTFGAKADAKNAATDTTVISAMSVLKQISASVQAPPSQAVTNTGTFAVQATPVTQADTFMLGGANIKEINGVAPLMGAGNGGTGSLRVNLASDQVSIPVAATLGTETTKVIGTVNQGTSPWATSLAAETTKVIGTVNQGTSPWVTSFNAPQHIIADSGTITAVTAITNALPAGTNLLGKVGIDQTTPGSTNAVTPVPAANSGWTFDYLAGGLNATKHQIKATAGTLGGYLWLYNPNVAATYIQIFNKASASVTVGTTAPDFVIVLPGIAAASATGSAANFEMVHGIAMGTGITVAATTTETGLTSPSANVFGTFLYK